MKQLLLLFTLCLFMSCQSKDTYLEDFQHFIDKVETKGADFTEQEWEKADAQYQKLGDSYAKFEKKMDASEKLKVAKCKADYLAFKVKHGIKNASKDIKDAWNDLKKDK